MYHLSVGVSNKESIAKRLLHDVKECLMNTVKYLYYKSTKKLRYLKKLMDELDSLVDLTDNFIKDDVVAPIKACGTRCIGHLVKALQRAIYNFGIYSTDLENFGKKKKNRR